MTSQKPTAAVSPLFTVALGGLSHMLRFEAERFDHTSEGEPAGQLVICREGEIELFGHAGEWLIPADHMVYIPPHRWFRVRAREPANGLVVRFCQNEVSWRHDGCWVGPLGGFATELLENGLKWSVETASNRRARCFFVTLGDLVPNWFVHERILWTSYAQNSAIQRALDFARARGPSVSVIEVADHVGMSERTLRRHMQAELGQSWREFIREFRMNRAMEMLRKDRLSITETAFQVGFSSSSAFSSAFLEYVGQPPSAYARAYRPALAKQQVSA
jgi:AraC-like DNA-binding protein